MKTSRVLATAVLALAAAPFAAALADQAAPEAATPLVEFRSTSECVLPLSFKLYSDRDPSFTIDTRLGDVRVELEPEGIADCKTARYVSKDRDALPTVEVELIDLCVGRLPTGFARVAFSGVAYECALEVRPR